MTALSATLNSREDARDRVRIGEVRFQGEKPSVLLLPLRDATATL
jgi:hypothetical protein